MNGNGTQNFTITEILETQVTTFAGVLSFFKLL
jgi:hypothetical protein